MSLESLVINERVTYEPISYKRVLVSTHNALPHLQEIQTLFPQLFLSGNYICGSTLALVCTSLALEETSPDLAQHLGITTDTRRYKKPKQIYLPDNLGLASHPSPLSANFSILKAGLGQNYSGVAYDKEKGLFMVVTEDRDKLVIDRLANSSLYRLPSNYLEFNDKQLLEDWGKTSPLSSSVTTFTYLYQHFLNTGLMTPYDEFAYTVSEETAPRMQQ